MKSKQTKSFSRQNGYIAADDTFQDSVDVATFKTKMRAKPLCKLCWHESCMRTVFANLRVIIIKYIFTCFDAVKFVVAQLLSSVHPKNIETLIVVKKEMLKVPWILSRTPSANYFVFQKQAFKEKLHHSRTTKRYSCISQTFDDPSYTPNFKRL